MFPCAPKTYFVYIMPNRSQTLYTGVTGNLVSRVCKHRLGIGCRFTAKYKIDRRVYFQRSEDIRNAIEREEQIKGLLRIKKIAMVASVNPEWKDLSEKWREHHAFEPARQNA